MTYCWRRVHISHKERRILLTILYVRQVSLTDDIGAIRRAFRELETQSQKQQAKDAK